MGTQRATAGSRAVRLPEPHLENQPWSQIQALQHKKPEANNGVLVPDHHRHGLQLTPRAFGHCHRRLEIVLDEIWIEIHLNLIKNF